MKRALALLLGTTVGALIVAGAWRLKHPPTPMQDIELHVVDARGDPVQDFRWSYWDETPGAVISPFVPQGLHPGGAATARVPEHRISIEIEANGLHRTRFGPFESDAIPTRIDAVLGDLEIVAGTVMYAGQPIAGATVVLLVASSDVVEGVPSGLLYGYDKLRATSDERGAFRIGADGGLTPYFVRAWKQGHAAGTSGPVRLGASPVEVSLHDGGTLEGALHLRDAHSTDGVELELYREERIEWHGDPLERFFARAQNDGRFHFEHVDVGPWLVRVRGSTGVDHLPFVVEVSEGATTTLEMDLTRPPIEIDGRLTLNGEPFSHAWPTLLVLGSKALCVDATAIDGDDRFVLFTRAPGNYRLLIQCNHHHDTRQPRRISDLIEVPASGARWQHDIVRGENDPDEIVLDREH